MVIQWLGHASFLIVTGAGKKIITDPYEPGSFQGTLNYAPIRVAPDIVTISHQHADHDAFDSLPNHFEVVSRSGERTVHGIRIRGIESYHDSVGGTKRGTNVIFVMEVDGMRVCHLGDLGQTLIPQQVEQIGHVDVLLIPVGGNYTIGPDQADHVIKQLNPKIVIPMHFKTNKIEFPILPVNDFINGKENVQLSASAEIEISKEQLPSQTMIVVLQHSL